MALAGTFDAFSILEVALWLQNVGRPGCLIAEVGHGEALVWFGERGIVAAESASGYAQEPAAVLFEILRAGPIAWRYQSLVSPPGGGAAPVDVSSCAASMENLVAEWADLLALVPSVDGYVHLNERLAQDVTLNADRWDAVRRLAGGPVAAKAMFNGIDDLDARRRIADLVRAGLAVVELPAPPEPVRTLDPAAASR